jgi:hypothetical protein
MLDIVLVVGMSAMNDMTRIFNFLFSKIAKQVTIADRLLVSDVFPC